MDRTLPNKCTKFGAKIFRSYWVITFLVLGHFFKPHPVELTIVSICFIIKNMNRTNQTQMVICKQLAITRNNSSIQLSDTEYVNSCIWASNGIRNSMWTSDAYTVEHHLYRFRRPLGSRLATFLPTMTVSHKPAAYGFWGVENVGLYLLHTNIRSGVWMSSFSLSYSRGVWIQTASVSTTLSALT